MGNRFNDSNASSQALLLRGIGADEPGGDDGHSCMGQRIVTADFISQRFAAKPGTKANKWLSTGGNFTSADAVLNSRPATQLYALVLHQAPLAMISSTLM